MGAASPKSRAPARARSVRWEDAPAGDGSGRKIEASQHGPVRLKAEKAARAKPGPSPRRLRSTPLGRSALVAPAPGPCPRFAEGSSRQNSLNHKRRYRASELLIQALELVGEFVV